MIITFIDYWNKDKDKLEEYFKSHEQYEYNDYGSLVKLVFDIIVNPNLNNGITGHEFYAYDTDNILEIDDGDYQGTLVFVLHENTYQPFVTNYLYTYVNYGSCSHCDTLQAIQDMSDNYEIGIPTEEQVKDYMSLCLHLLESCKHFNL